MRAVVTAVSRTWAVLAIAVLLGLACAIPTAGAQQSQGTTFNLQGKITEASPGKLTVSTEENIIFHVSYDSETSIRRKDGSAGSAADLKAGATIKVAGDLIPTGVIKASVIQIE